MEGYVVMVDMDQTLIESVQVTDPRYSSSNGKEIVYTISEYGLNGILITNTYIIKVSVRPYATEMVRSIVNNGHKYIIWSAGVTEYVHAVMKYFNELSGVIPQEIYTRKNMVNYYGNFYKSMKSLGYPLDRVIIIEDNRNLVHPDERSRVIDVSPWVHGNYSDTDMSYVIQSMLIYSEVSQNQPKKGRTFILTSVQ